MESIRKTSGRRNFLKSSVLAGGGLVLGFNWFNSCKPAAVKSTVLSMPKEWFELNAFLKIGENGVVTILAPNPEFGQNVKTSMPMIVADELDIDWENVVVEQAIFNNKLYGNQFTGGSRGISTTWKNLRIAGATARQMLKEAAAKIWQVPVNEITTEAGVLHHQFSGKSAGYGSVAAAAANIPVPSDVSLKEIKDFKIISTSRKNVDGLGIVTGKPLFGVDYTKEGTLTAMIVHPPAFGLKFKAMDDSLVRTMPGIKDVFVIKSLQDDYKRGGFDTTAFTELVAIVGQSTWEVMNAKKALKVEWEPFADYTETVAGWGGDQIRNIPGGLENTQDHIAAMTRMAAKKGKVLRKDGDPAQAFKRATKMLERTYTAPFLAHNSMEPINFFAHVTADKAEVAGPLQAPGVAESTIAARLNIPLENIKIHLTRMGGGFGRRAYIHYAVEAALISQKVEAPIRLLYTREDDMTFGIYRPAYHATYKAALDENNQLIAYQVKAGGIPESPLGWAANRFPAGAVDNYLAEDWSVTSNITIGAFRAPHSNFLAGAEQSFLDEVAELAGQDPIDFRLQLLEKAKTSPVGERNDYDPARYAGVLEMVRDKASWTASSPTHRGVSAYFCHNSYAAHVLELEMKDGHPQVNKVVCAIDCRVVVNPDAAVNMAEGAIVDGIGCAMYGALTFKGGVAQQNNFHNYHQIRCSEAPKAIEVHFVQNEKDPTGMGEPPFPPIFGALANALYKATGTRHYHQPFSGQNQMLG